MNTNAHLQEELSKLLELKDAQEKAAAEFAAAYEALKPQLMDYQLEAFEAGESSTSYSVAYVDAMGTETGRFISVQFKTNSQLLDWEVAGTIEKYDGKLVTYKPFLSGLDAAAFPQAVADKLAAGELMYSMDATGKKLTLQPADKKAKIHDVLDGMVLSQEPYSTTGLYGAIQDGSTIPQELYAVVKDATSIAVSFGNVAPTAE